MTASGPLYLLFPSFFVDFEEEKHEKRRAKRDGFFLESRACADMAFFWPTDEELGGVALASVEAPSGEDCACCTNLPEFIS